MAKHFDHIERVICRLDKETHSYVLFFTDIKERDGTMVSWREGEGHAAGNPQDDKFCTPPLWDGAQEAMKKYRKQYRGNYALSRRQS